MRLPSIDTERAIEELTRFLRQEFERTGFARAVVGLSGGIDSGVAVTLAARALGPENVWAVMMPYRTSSRESVEDAEAVIEVTGVHAIREEITPQIDAYLAAHEEADRVRRGNKMARERMSILYDHAQRLSALVVGTGNRTEAMLGYTTQYGDNACALNPVAPLLKAHVRAVARALSLPDRLIEKPPSADLWAGQTDEEELGFTYEEVDPLLHAMFDLNLPKAELLAEGFPEALVDAVTAIHARTAFKRVLPPSATLSPEVYT